MNRFPKKLKDKLYKREQDNALRKLPIGTNLVDFASNDYLGFAVNETIYTNTFQFLSNKGIMNNGSTGSRLLSGNYELYNELETCLASSYKAENALVFNSGYSANLGFFSAVPQRGDIILFDEYIHASIRDGIQLSHAKSYKYQHNDINDLIEKCEANKEDGNLYVVTESVFSMDGDSPDFLAISKVCKKYKANFVVDEAHAIGVFGENGIGLIPFYKLEKEVFARIITFGKAIGSHGATVLGSDILIEYLINFSRSFIYTTAMPPHSLATTLSAIKYGMSEPALEFRNQLKENIRYFNQKVESLKLNSIFIPSISAIQCCIVPGNDNVKNVAKKIQENGFGVYPILSPTVPKGEERLRFCLHSHNTPEEIGTVLKSLKRYL